jgi:hypothetical protein
MKPLPDGSRGSESDAAASRQSQEIRGSQRISGKYQYLVCRKSDDYTLAFEFFTGD